MSQTKLPKAGRLATHKIRIIGGTYKRTPIPVLNLEGLRPTPDRVRETVFNWLGFLWARDYSHKKVLDLFAGTGAMGFEAASRGAQSVHLIERDPKAAAALQALRTKLQAQNITIEHADAFKVLAKFNGSMQFDLIVLDPPYTQVDLVQLWALLPAILAPDGLVYVESDQIIDPPTQYQLVRQDKAGIVHFALLRLV